MHNITLTRGIPGSGKTTWAKEYVAQSNGTVKRISKDDLRLMFDGSHEFGNKHSGFLDDVRDALVHLCYIYDFDVVVDETFVRQRDINDFRAVHHSNDTTITVREFNTPLETCIERDEGRPFALGENVIREYYDILQKEGSVV